MPFRWGIGGSGGIANKFADAVRGVEGADISGVLSRDRDRAQAFCDQHGAGQPVDSLEALAEKGRVDAVYVASPHRFHHEQALACLRAGTPVLCEKPLCVNAKQTAELIEVSRAGGVFLMEAMWSRFLPIFEQVHAWLDEGRLGEVKWVQSTFGMPAFYRVAPTHRLVNPDLAGGAILDMGIYPIAVTQDIYGGDPQTVQAVGQVTDRGVDLFSGATLDYGEGRAAQFMCTLLSTSLNKMFIHGREGRIEIEPAFFASTQASLHLKHDVHTVTRPFRVNGFEYQIEESMACIGRGEAESARMPHAQTLANARVIDTIRGQIGARYDFE